LKKYTLPAGECETMIENHSRVFDQMTNYTIRYHHEWPFFFDISKKQAYNTINEGADTINMDIYNFYEAFKMIHNIHNRRQKYIKHLLYKLCIKFTHMFFKIQLVTVYVVLVLVSNVNQCDHIRKRRPDHSSYLCIVLITSTTCKH